MQHRIFETRVAGRHRPISFAPSTQPLSPSRDDDDAVIIGHSYYTQSRCWRAGGCDGRAGAHYAMRWLCVSMKHFPRALNIGRHVRLFSHRKYEQLLSKLRMACLSWRKQPLPPPIYLLRLSADATPPIKRFVVSCRNDDGLAYGAMMR